MASDLQAGFSNNINIMQIRTSGASMQRVTDRPIDFDNDGNEEVISVTPGTQTGAANKKRNPPSIPSSATNSLLGGDNAGVARSVINQETETDGGVDTTGSEFTEGIE